jgi:hypothetical protein
MSMDGGGNRLPHFYKGDFSVFGRKFGWPKKEMGSVSDFSI